MRFGRPIGSEIRQNIIEILYFFGKIYGYKLYNIYIDIFPKVSQRSIYYHLKKGAQLGEFIVKADSKEGDYSWGNNAEVVYYSLGPESKPTANERVKIYKESLKLSKKTK